MANIINNTESWTGHTKTEVETYIKSKLEDGVFESGDGTNSAILKGSRCRTIGNNSVAEGHGEIQKSDTLSDTDERFVITGKTTQSITNNPFVSNGTYPKYAITSTTKFVLRVGQVLSSNSDGSNYKAIIDVPDSTHFVLNEVFSPDVTNGAIYILTGIVLGDRSHLEGNGCFVIGNDSHVEGCGSSAAGHYSHAEGLESAATGKQSHAEGKRTTASKSSSHAEGEYTTASGSASHAEGLNTIASGPSAHAEGESNEAAEDCSHAEGYNNKVYSGAGSSHVEGSGNEVRNSREHAQGSYNISHTLQNHGFNNSSEKTLHSVGMGTSNNTRKNAFEIMQNGEIYICGVGGYDGTNPTSKVNSLQKVLETLGITIDWTKLGLTN